MGRIFDRLHQKRVLRRWRRAVRLAETAPLADLRAQRNDARQLRCQIDKLLHVADGRLALPRIGSTSFPRPQGTDWAWRPELWRGPLPVPGISSAPTRSRLGNEITLFHDCPRAEMTLRQLRNTREADLAPFGLGMDVFSFGGTFLSLVIDLPSEAVEGLTRDNLLRVDTTIEMETPLEIFARLNIRNGPNTEQIVRELPLDAAEVMVEFDLAYARMNEKRIERLWLDLIFEAPEMNQVILRDLTFARYRRAPL